MTDTFQRDRLPPQGKRRADDIRIHRPETRKSRGPLIGLGLLGIGLLALWGYRGRQHAATCAEQTIAFPQHSAELSSTGRVALGTLATCLRANPTQIVRLEGRADTSEMATNAALPRSRVDSLLVELDRLGVPASRVMVGEAPTACSEGIPGCRGASATPEISRY